MRRGQCNVYYSMVMMNTKTNAKIKTKTGQVLGKCVQLIYYIAYHSRMDQTSSISHTYKVFVQVTSINQAKKLILVVNTLLCFLRSLSDSLIPCVTTEHLFFSRDIYYYYYQPSVVVVCFFRNLKMAP